MTEILLYGEVGYDFDSKWLNSTLEKADDDVVLYVNSVGGDVFEGVAINSVIARHKRNGKHISARVEGVSASAASYMCAACDEILLEKGACMLIHDPSSICLGRAAEMRETAQALDVCKESILDIYTARSTKDRNELYKAMKDETWLSANDAVEWGLADKTVSEDRDPARSTAVEKWVALPESQEYAAFAMKNPACASTLHDYKLRAKDFRAKSKKAFDFVNKGSFEAGLTICGTESEPLEAEAVESEREEASRWFCDGWNVFQIRKAAK